MKLLLHFDTIQVLCFAAGVFFFFFSLYFHLKNKETLTLLSLFFTALFIFSFAALLDPFLNIWDERFHALVAKNLLAHPLVPTLYDEMVVNMNYTGWDKTHIWLHKQPLFLWQIALSFKLFGINEFALRLPSIILGILLVLTGYRCGKLLVNERTGYLTGILLLSSNFLIELIAGRQITDHNDLSFTAYVSLSIWALIEYQYSKKIVWIFLIGIFSGFAILCKWLVGLLVYLGWMVIKFQEKKFNFLHYKDFIISFFITLTIVLPWQILIFTWFPEEAKMEFIHANSHFFESIEGHSGDYLFHFNEFNKLFGLLSLLLIIPSLIVLYIKCNNRKVYFSLLIMIVVVYGFFSMAHTKMVSFPFVTALMIFLSLGSLLDFIVEKLAGFITSELIKTSVVVFTIALIGIIRIDIDNLMATHTLLKPENNYTPMMVSNKKIFQTLNLPSNAVIFNVKGRHYVEAMFYTGLPAYNFIPSQEQYVDLKYKNRVAAIFLPAIGGLPDYIEVDTTVIKLNSVIEGYN